MCKITTPSRNVYTNHSGYRDSTAGAALSHIMREKAAPKPQVYRKAWSARIGKA